MRTTNIIERLNKEFKRRTKPMEIVAGENPCYTLQLLSAFRWNCIGDQTLLESAYEPVPP
ncbi:MAG: hypothetical protein SWO11_07275 [Thermodesulfobacteriota bacterium]|nr:hypothetical protein [Thermodesulfobacteriota bacterium]